MVVGGWLVGGWLDGWWLVGWWLVGLVVGWICNTIHNISIYHQHKWHGQHICKAATTFCSLAKFMMKCAKLLLLEEEEEEEEEEEASSK